MEPSDPDLPGPDAVRAQFARMLASPDFEVPDRLRTFLTFVIDETLAGRGDRIKAYSIATRVFGRKDDFDMLNDPVVRIEAGRLRRALERYRLKSGRFDPVVIDMPKGGYVPTFSWSGASAPEDEKAPAETIELPPVLTKKAPPRRRRIRAALLLLGLSGLFTVLAMCRHQIGARSGEASATAGPEISLTASPFANLSGPEGELYAAGISEELLNQLARFRELKIIGHNPAAPGEAVHSSGPSRERYRLEGGVRVVGKHLRVSARLLHGRTARIVWSQLYDRDLHGAGSFDVESDIAAKISTAIAQPYGAIFTPISSGAHARVPDSAEAYHCVLRFYQYRKVLSREEHAHTRECLEQTASRFPSYSTGWAMLAYTYLDEERFGLNRRPGSGKDRARKAAERAVLLDPVNVRGLQALMTVLFFQREPEAALRIGEKALALNPNDTELLAELGSRIAQTGDWKRGTSMVEAALEQNSAHTNYYAGLVAQGYYMQGDIGQALAWIRRAELRQFSVFHFVAALIFARAGLEPETKASAAELLRMRPRFFDDFDADLAMRNFNARDRAILIAGAKQAGFPVRSVGP